MMPKCVSVLALVLAAIALPSIAAAQEPGKVGVTAGFPEAIGVLWHAGEKIALRPEFTFEWLSSDGDGADVDAHVWTTGVSLLYYLRKEDRLSTYVSPRYAYGRSTTNADTPFSDEVTSGITSHLLSGSFGAQYSLNDRFSAFGELGVDYQHRKADNDFSDNENTSNSFGTRTAVGVIFYF
jgi:hypothetical protein